MDMAVATREIPPNEWRSYFDEVSRELEGMRARVEITGRERIDQVEADGQLLTAISYDDRDDIVVIGVGAADLLEDLEHIVYHPRRITIASGDGNTTAFDIESAEGTHTLVRLEPSA